MTAGAHDQQRCNAVLERLLARAGWTPENLGDRLNELATAHGLGLHGHRRTPRRWVYAELGRAAPRVPRDPWPSLVCHVLHERLGEPVTLEALGWADTGTLRYVPADHGLDQPWDANGTVVALASVVDADAMERRHFLALTGVTLTAVAHQWLFDPARVAASVMGKRVDHAVVNDLERVAGARRRMDDALGGGTLLPAVREDLRLVVAMLKNAAYSEEVGKRLHAVAAEYGRLAGWVADDCNQPALSQRYFLAAMRAAQVSGDRAIGANVLGNMSVQAAQSSNPRDAITLAESALSAATQLTPAVTASLHGRLALGAAYAGDAVTWGRALNRSFELLAQSVPEDEPPWIYWFNQADAEGLAGWSLLALGRPTEAESHLRHAVSTIDPAFARDRSGMLLDLATARLGAGAVDRACATASEAAATIRRLDSPREKRLLGTFRRAAAPYATSAAVREFDAKHRDLVGPSMV
jgi:tetratricopeptide (TPR) repeat protein